MIWLLKLIFGKLKPLPPVQPDPPPWDVPLDQTMAPLHKHGDVASV